LEEVIATHSAVAEVCVIGVHDPDGGGHVPRAFVTIKHDYAGKNNGSIAKEILEYANGKSTHSVDWQSAAFSFSLTLRT